MDEEFNRLLELMNEARQEADEANSIAYDLRQEAVRMQFKATAAADAASLTAELLRECTDPKFLSKIAEASKEAIRKTIIATGIAATAVLKANESDQLVTSAFNKCREAANQLYQVLERVPSHGN